MAIRGLNWTSRPGRFMRWFSLFWIIAGAGFVVAGILGEESSRSTFLGIGGIWFAVGLFLRFLGGWMLKGYRDRERLIATGTPGQARILSMTQTGLSVNDQPQVELELEVEPTGRPPYRVTRKEIVPLIALGRLSSGMPLPVKIDPKNQENLAIEWESGAAPVTAMPFANIPGMTVTPAPEGTGMHFKVDGPGGPTDLGDMTQQGNVDAFKQRMKSLGQRGEATLDEVVDTGTSVGENKLYVTSMTIRVPGKAPYTSKSPSLVAPKRIPQLVLGAKVPVWVDPANPNMILADWDAADTPHVPGS